MHACKRQICRLAAKHGKGEEREIKVQIKVLTRHYEGFESLHNIMTGKGQLQMYFKMSLGQFEALLQTLALNLKKREQHQHGHCCPGSLAVSLRKAKLLVLFVKINLSMKKRLLFSQPDVHILFGKTSDHSAMSAVYF